MDARAATPADAPGRTRKRLPRQFGAYAKMEAVNVLLVPGLALWLGWPRQAAEFVAMGVSIAACAGLLVVGAFYWHGLDRRLQGQGRATLDRALAMADRLERPMLLATAAAVLATVAAAALHGFTASVIAAAVLTLLAVLEHVNYYHRQVQHFDKLADLKRLLSGRALRPSHMARDLSTYRASRR